MKANSSRVISENAAQGSNVTTVNEANRRENKSSTTVCVDSNTSILLQTANASVSRIHQPHPAVTIRILLDRGSQRSYISERVKEKLDLFPKRKEKLLIKRKRRLKRVWHCQILCQSIESKFRRSDDCSYRPSYLRSFGESSRTVCSTIIQSSGRLKTRRSTIPRLWFRSRCLNWQRFLSVFLHWRHETGGIRTSSDEDESWMGVTWSFALNTRFRY